jgi:hypothetical protein
MVRNSTRSHDRLVPRSLPAPATSSPSSASDDDNPVISVLPFSPPVRTVPADKFYNKASSSRSKLKTYGKHTVNPRNLYRLSKDDHESPSVRRVQPHRPKRDEPKLLGLKPTDFGISTSAIKLHDPPWYTEESDSPDDTLSPAKHEPRKEKQTQLRWDTPTPKKECRTLCEPVECPFCWAPYVRVEKLWETDAFVEYVWILRGYRCVWG